jgi:predicted O-methyltransferase YrrM
MQLTSHGKSGGSQLISVLAGHTPNAPMNDAEIVGMPGVLESIRRDTRDLGFNMASESKTGALLKVLAASKPGGRFLELGTGTGVGTAWLLAGMDATARLDSVDSDERVLAVARRHLAADPRVTFHLADGAEFLARLPSGQFDFVYADTWPGKFMHLGVALSLCDVAASTSWTICFLNLIGLRGMRRRCPF